MFDAMTFLAEGGPFMYPVLTGLVVLPLVAFWLFLTQALRWRFPNFLALGAALTIVSLGLIGTWYGSGLALEAIGSADPSFVDQLAAQGYAVALYPSIVAFALGALGCAAFAIANGFGLLVRPGEKSEPTWAGLAGGLVFGLITLPLAFIFSGWFSGLVAAMVALAQVLVGTRFPFETDRDRARAVSGRFVVGFHGFFAFVCTAGFLFCSAESSYFLAYQAPPEMVSMLQAQATAGLEMAVGTAFILAVAVLLMGLFQGSARFEDLDGRGWASGVLYALTPVLVLVPLGMAGWNLLSLRTNAVPWHELRAPKLQAGGVRPPRLDRDLKPIARADTLQLTDAGMAFNDKAAKAGLEVGDTLNIEADPDIALARFVAMAPEIEGASLCLTVRAFDVLSCLPFRMATGPEGEKPRSLLADAQLPELQLVPQDRGWVLMRGADQILGRGDMAQLATLLPAGKLALRLWMPEGRTVEDLVAAHKTLSQGEAQPVLVWRADPAPTVAPPATGDDAMKTDGVDREVIRETMGRYSSQMRFCYERSLKSRPSLQGSVVVHFTIGPTGTVLEASTHDSTLGDQELERCLETRVRNLRFPKPKGGQAVVEYPFVFRPE